MAFKAKMLGREAVMRKLNQIVPEAEKQLAEAQLDVAREAASRIAARAPTGATGEYKASIEGARLADRPKDASIFGRATKDKNATGVFAAWFWRFRNATASAMQQMTASITDIDGRVTAQASALLGVEASVDEVSAGGLISFKAAVPPPAGLLAQIAILARATTADTFKQSGLVIQVYDQGGVIKSRVVVLADQFVVTDGSASGQPIIFEGGEMKLQVARIGTAIVEELRSANGKLVIKGSGTDAYIEILA